MFNNKQPPIQTGAPAMMSIAADMPNAIVSIGNGQHQGARPYQEDSFGFSDVSPATVARKGVLAVLADGMGGLKNGRAVSGTLVAKMLEVFNAPNVMCTTGQDLKTVATAINREVCNTFCSSGRIESGSTLVSVIIKDGYLHWLCVGDSRLYIKRGERIYQVNEDHDFLNQMLDDVITGNDSMADALSNPQKDSLVGCIGKKDLDLFDYSKRGYKLKHGDLIVLCSDGIYNALSYAELCANVTYDAMGSCSNIINLVASKRIPNQDNNTILVLSYQEK